MGNEQLGENKFSMLVALACSLTACFDQKYALSYKAAAGHP
jgi:hypothetical protein